MRLKTLEWNFFEFEKTDSRKNMHKTDNFSFCGSDRALKTIFSVCEKLQYGLENKSFTCTHDSINQITCYVLVILKN